MTRTVRAVAVQPKWHAHDFLNAAAFERWMKQQLEMARPHLSATHPNLVVLTELNGLPLVLRGGALAAASGKFEWAAALLFVHHLPQALPILVKEKVSPIRALQLARANENAALYLKTCQKLARECGVYLVSGSTPMPHYQLCGTRLRREGRALYNQTLIFAPDGSLIGSADKVHLTPDEQAGGVDLTPGKLEDLRVFPTPVGDLGVAISLDAFRADVIGKLMNGGCTVLLQPDANGSPWTGKEGIYPAGQQPRDQPLAWLESSWQVTDGNQIRYAVNPMVVGNLLDMTFDGQSAITGPDEGEVTEGGLSYVMTPPRRGFLALLPWVSDGTPQELREVGQQLAAGSGHPLENAYLSGAVHADLHLPPSTLVPPPATPHERALTAFLEGQASLPLSPLRWGWAALLTLLGASWWLIRRLQRRK
ncbi:carbon-nitrogen hydrolase family protein [Deinococcus detaillensis]|uniref:Carbon-nitrogen hydrolase family protein n=1 Tax=Deinococcus detaillensis TaxID=2592048 RepID=A0A553V5Y9_9DEIO|nr:nitrilase-related carbon-nitrogen hydrolase [Deinococcus detaillensis]TSA87893.1 carbon-nitrogen hydrolase family protein [Deinococcus detaillensis]